MNDTIFDYGSVAPAAANNGAITVAMVIVGVLLIAVLAALAYVLRKALTRPELHGLNRDEIRRRWEEIEKVSASGLMGAKMAIVEADKLLDGALKSMTIPGDTLGERLKFATYRYPELRKVWFAHRLRNQIVHETTFELSSSQAKSAIHEYRKALKTINVI